VVVHGRIRACAYAFPTDFTPPGTFEDGDDAVMGYVLHLGPFRAMVRVRFEDGMDDTLAEVMGSPKPRLERTNPIHKTI